MIPVLLQPNSLYCIDLEMFCESSLWRTSFELLKEQNKRITIADILEDCCKHNTPILKFKELILLFFSNMQSLHNICLLESEKQELRQLLELVLGANQTILEAVDNIPTMDVFLLENSDITLLFYWNGPLQDGKHTGQVYVAKDHKFMFSDKHMSFIRSDFYSITILNENCKLQLSKCNQTGLYTLSNIQEGKHFVLCEVPSPTIKKSKWKHSLA